MNDDSTILIPLTQGQFALIDSEDAVFISQHKWAARKTRSGDYYASRSRYRQNGRQETVYMHREILERKLGIQLEAHFTTDHKNKNKLDNRRGNLRVATKSQNNANYIQPRKSKSGIRGIHRVGSKWVARISHKDRNIYIGSYNTPEEASAAYKEKAIELRGEEFVETEQSSIAS